MNGYTDEKILMLILNLFLLLMLMLKLMLIVLLMLNVDVNADIVTQAVAHFGAYHRPSDSHFSILSRTNNPCKGKLFRIL